ncbi:MAG: YunC family protein [Candidatus Bathyarchaeia archaeon]
MFEIDKFEIEGKSFQGVKSKLPDLPPLLLIKGISGFVMCGYLNLDVAEKLDAAAAVVSGVSTFEEVLNAEISAVTSKAEGLGVKPGMVVREALPKLG